jgi:adenosylcobinamide-GDP ribazoletransferase
MAVTGGLHMDGLMDTCDAAFSRKNRKERLEILSDSHVGAFAVMGCAAVLMLKAGVFCELFASLHSDSVPWFPVILMALIPVFSRFGLGILFYLPFAKEDGLARTLGASRVLRDRYILWAGFALLATAVSPLGINWLFAPLAGAVTLVFHGRYCVKNFGGITGDLMGAYVELSETLMLLTLIIARR